MLQEADAAAETGQHLAQPDERALRREDGGVALVRRQDVLDGLLERVSGPLPHLERRRPVQAGQLAPGGAIPE